MDSMNQKKLLVFNQLQKKGRFLIQYTYNRHTEYRICFQLGRQRSLPWTFYDSYTQLLLFILSSNSSYKLAGFGYSWPGQSLKLVQFDQEMLRVAFFLTALPSKSTSLISKSFWRIVSLLLFFLVSYSISFFYLRPSDFEIASKRHWIAIIVCTHRRRRNVMTNSE
jgi:hypothetical protein